MDRMRLLLCALLAFAVTGCGTGDTGGGGPDAAAGAPDAAPGCPDPTSALPQDWRPIASVSGGAVESAAASGVTTTTVDASAGGFGNSGDEPYVYLDLSGSETAKVAIDDVTSYGSTDWDIALKRFVIRANGGDSGPGGVAVSRVVAGSIEEVTSEPAAQTFVADNFASPSCTFLGDQIGAPTTAFTDWYDIENTILTPRALVFVVRLRDGSLVKLEIETYYGDPADPNKSAIFRFRSAPL
jgi:hypothetical protein